MSGFFTDLYEYNLLNNWTEILDWLSNDNRFSEEEGWTKTKKASFTKGLKENLGFTKKHEGRFICNTLKNLNFPQEDEIKRIRQNNDYLVMMCNSKSVGEAFIKHIRNGIAHGHAIIVPSNSNGELLLIP